MNKRISIDSYKLEKELFKQFNMSQNCQKTLELIKLKMPEILDKELTNMQYNVVIMYYYKDFTQVEIATLLSKSQSSISRTLKSAKAKIFSIVKYLI